MKALQQALTRTFAPVRSRAPRPAATSQRRERQQAQALALQCGCTIERCTPGWNVWPPKPVPGVAQPPDPYEGDHYCQDWKEVLAMVQHWAGTGASSAPQASGVEQPAASALAKRARR